MKSQKEIEEMIGQEVGTSRARESSRKAEILAYLEKLALTEKPFAGVDDIHKKMSFSQTKRQSTFSALREMREAGIIKGKKNPAGSWRFWVVVPAKK